MIHLSVVARRSSVVRYTGIRWRQRGAAVPGGTIRRARSTTPQVFADARAASGLFFIPSLGPLRRNIDRHLCATILLGLRSDASWRDEQGKQNGEEDEAASSHEDSPREVGNRVAVYQAEDHRLGRTLVKAKKWNDKNHTPKMVDPVACRTATAPRTLLGSGSVLWSSRERAGSSPVRIRATSFSAKARP